MRTWAAVVVVAAALAGCAGDTTATTCVWKGKTHADGEVFADECNTCQCNPDGTMPGEVGCTLIACSDAGVPDGR